MADTEGRDLSRPYKEKQIHRGRRGMAQRSLPCSGGHTEKVRRPQHCAQVQKKEGRDVSRPYMFDASQRPPGMDAQARRGRAKSRPYNFIVTVFISV